MIRSLGWVIALLLVMVPIRFVEADEAGRVLHAASPTATVRVRSGSSPFSAECAPKAVAELVVGFLEAVNRGDPARSAAFFPGEPGSGSLDDPGFRWYSVTDAGAHGVLYDPAELPTHFAARAAQHDRFWLVDLQIASAWHPGVSIVFDVVREADDFPRREVGGKGAVDCVRRQIIAWSLGDVEVLAKGEGSRATPMAEPAQIAAPVG